MREILPINSRGTNPNIYNATVEDDQKAGIIRVRGMCNKTCLFKKLLSFEMIKLIMS